MFDSIMFRQAQFNPRRATVTLPAMACFFEAGDAPDFVVRQLTGYELAKCQEAVSMNRGVSALVAGLVGDDNAEKIEQIRKTLGVSDSVPDEIAKRIEMLVIASVEPAMDREMVVKLCANFPVEFYQLTTEITRLTGEGAELGELRVSGAETISD